MVLLLSIIIVTLIIIILLLNKQITKEFLYLPLTFLVASQLYQLTTSPQLVTGGKIEKHKSKQTMSDPKPSDFPYKRNFLTTPAEELFDNVKHYDKFLELKGNEITKNYKTYLLADIVTDLFTEDIRVKASVNGRQSPLDYWNANKQYIKKQVTKSYNEKSDEKKDLKKIEDCREYVYKHCSEATTFSPTVSAFMYSLMKKPGRVYDPFGGWGDRMIGAVCSDSVLTYTCTDLNEELARGYREISKYSNKITFNIGDALELIKKQQSNSYEMIFTSPPYFNYENYGKPLPNNYAKWLDEFVEPLIKEGFRILDTNGLFAIHISNIRNYPLFDDFKRILDKYGSYLTTYYVMSKNKVPILVYRKN